MSNPQQPFQPQYPEQPGQQPQQYGGYAPPPNTPEQGSYAPPSNGQQPPAPWSPYPEQPGGYSQGNPYGQQPSTPNPYGQQPSTPNPYGQQPSMPNPYSQPVQNNPYTPPGAPQQFYGGQGRPGGTSVDFQRLMLPENRMYLTAGIGGLVALLSYFFISSYDVSGFGLSGTDFAGSGKYTGLWLMVLGAIAAVAISALLAFGSNAVPQLNPLNGAKWLIGCGAVGVLMLVIVLFHFNADGVGSWGFGFFLSLAGMIAVLVAGIISYRRLQAPPMLPPTNMPPYQGPRY